MVDEVVEVFGCVPTLESNQIWKQSGQSNIPRTDVVWRASAWQSRQKPIAVGCGFSTCPSGSQGTRASRVSGVACTLPCRSLSITLLDITADQLFLAVTITILRSICIECCS